MLDPSHSEEDALRSSEGRESGIVATVAPHPFRTESRTVVVSCGMTLDEILSYVQPDVFMRSHAHIFLNGDLVERDRWKVVMPRAGDYVGIRVVPTGGEGGGKSILRAVLAIGVLVVATVFGGPLGAALGLGTGKLGVAIGTGLISLGGTFLLNAVAPIRPPAGRDTQVESNNYFIDAAQNSLRPFDPVPVVLGRHRIVPPLGAQPYTEIVGDDHYLRMIVVWGYGPLNIEDIRIDETPIADFDDVEIDTRRGEAGEPDLTIYTRDVSQQQLSIELTQAGGWVSRTTTQTGDELAIDLTLPQGLTQIDDMGVRSDTTVQIQVAYREVGTTAWLAPPLGMATRTGPGELGPQDSLPDPHDYGAIATFPPSDYQMTTQTPTVSHGIITLTHNRHTPIRHGARWHVDPTAQYEVRVRRTTADSTSDRLFNTVYWSALKSYADRDPINFPHPLARTALSIRASDQLHGTVNRLNAIATTVCLDWNGSDWVLGPTSNPASLYRLVLQGPGRADPIPDSQVDLDALQRWHEFCESHGFEYNGIRDFSSSVFQTLSDIAAVGRASPSYADGKWSVVWDSGTQIPTQKFTSRNTRSPVCNRAFEPIPEGLRINFSNRDMGWRRDERIVFQDNFDETNAQVYSTIDAPGITSADHIYSFGRFHLAQVLLRRELWTFEVDFEYLVSARGDRVLIAQDVLLVGEASGRITQVDTNSSGQVTGIGIDEEVSMVSGRDYGVSIRTIVSVGVKEGVDTVPGVTKTLTFTNPIPSVEGVSVGDLISFGEMGVESIDGLITAIEPSGDLTARVSCLPWMGPGVYHADTETIPPYNTHLRALPGRSVLEIVRIYSEESTLVMEGGVLVPRVVIEVVPINEPETLIDCQFRAAGTTAPYENSQVVSQTPESITLSGLEVGNSYDLRLRWNRIGAVLPGPWTNHDSYTVRGHTGPPQALSGVSIHEWTDNTVLIRWTPITTLDFRAGAEIRFRHSVDQTSPTWENSVAIGSPVKGESYTVLPLKGGSYLARVFDARGRSSPVVVVEINEAAFLGYTNVVEIEEHPDFLGSKVNTAVTGNELVFVPGHGSGQYSYENQGVLSATTPIRVQSLIEVSGTDNTDAQVEFRTTEDDPVGAPVWSPWRPLETEQAIARAVQFRLQMDRSQLSDAFQIRQLGATIQTPSQPTIDTRTPSAPTVNPVAQGLSSDTIFSFLVGVTLSDDIARNESTITELQIGRSNANWTAAGGFPASDLVETLSGASVAVHTVLVSQYGNYFFSARSNNPHAVVPFSVYSSPVSAITERGTEDDSVSSAPMITAFRAVSDSEAVTLVIQRPALDWRTIWSYGIQVGSEKLPNSEVFATQIRNPIERGEGFIQEGDRVFRSPSSAWSTNEHVGRVLYIYRDIDIDTGHVEFPLANTIESNTASTITILGDPFRLPADAEMPIGDEDRAFDYLISDEMGGNAWLRTPEDLLLYFDHQASIENPAGGRSVPLENRITVSVPNDAWIRARSLNYWGLSPWSEQIQVSLIAADHPDPPAELRFSAGATMDSFDDLSAIWTPPIVPATFQYQRRVLMIDGTVDQGWPDLWADTTATTINLMDVSRGRIHEIRVRSLNLAGVSDFISESLVVPTAFGATPPDAPVVTFQDAGPTSFFASWTRPSGAVSFQYRIRADMRPDPMDPWVTTSDLRARFTVLAPGSTYHIEVRALSNNGAGPSSSRNIRLEVTGTIPRPSGLIVTTLSTTSFRASWNAVAEATGYEYEVGGVFGGVRRWVSAGNVLTITISGQPAGSYRFFSLRAINANAVSDSVGRSVNLPDPVFPPPQGPPDTPVNFSISAGVRRFNFSWSAPSSGERIERYRVSYSVTGNVTRSGTLTTSRTGRVLSSLAFINVTCVAQVRAENSAGASAYTATATARI